MKYVIAALMAVLGLVACDYTSRALECIDGCSELKGDKGNQGLPGITGPQGPANMCTVAPAPNGAQLSCSDGTSQFISNGTNGTDGSNGSNGSNGQDGTQITMVSFCNGVTTYPGTFIEIGFCIDHNLYAVYSENNGFLTLVPPGNYISNAHGSNCTFTVQPNCVVTH